ncbi:UNVERIFIED_CONTAM: hypothetical protein GTU68_000196 [Idotea baltica]|nr:hypothetical protein [Idotea baltica]
MLSLGLARVAEQAALASASLIGRGDEKAADQAAVNAMREQLNLLDIAGVVVIGEGERDEAPMLYIGEEVGTGNGPGVDIALDPLEGTTLTAKDMPNALTVIAMGPRGSMLHAPDVYMDKLAIGPGYSEGLVSLDMPPATRVSALATEKGCAPSDITVCILERPRHEEMIAEVRSTGAFSAESPMVTCGWRHALREAHVNRHLTCIWARGGRTRAGCSCACCAEMYGPVPDSGRCCPQ